MMDRHRVVNWLRRLCGRSETSTEIESRVEPVHVPLVLPEWAAWATEQPAPVRATRARPLATQLAMQARLNVPSSRKGAAKAKRPQPVAKRATEARSVHLQARHLAPKAKLTRPATINALPFTAPRQTSARPLQAAA